MTSTRITRRAALLGAGAGVAAAALATPARRTRAAVAARQGSAATIEIGLLQSFAEPDHPASQLIAAFNDLDLGVQVTGTGYGADYEAVLQRAQANISAQIGPALVSTGWKYALFADAALNIVDLREVGGDQLDTVLGRYRPWVVDIVRVGDKIAGLPFALSTPVLYYNQALFDEAGIAADVPMTTWDDVAAVATQVAEATGVEAALTGGIDEWEAQSFIQNSGGRVLDDAGQAVFDSPEAVAGLSVWTGLREAGHYLPMANDQMLPAFLGGNVAMYFTSIAGLRNIANGADFPVGTTAYPANGDRPTVMPSGGNFLGVYTQNPEQQQAAWTFLDFASSPAGIEIWNQSGYLVATTDELTPLPGQEPAYAQMEAGLTNETIWPGPRGLEALSVFNDWIGQIVNGTVSVEAGTRDGNAAVAALLP